MLLFRLPLLFNKKISFYKLLGTSRDGSFTMHPDFRKWAVLLVTNNEIDITSDHPSFQRHWLGSFIYQYLHFFNCKLTTYVIAPLEGHGQWDGKQIFGDIPAHQAYEGKIVSLTRATIRVKKIFRFQKQAAPVDRQVQQATGLLQAYGLSEFPLFRQITFSIWESREDLKAFAYQGQAHANAVKKTRADHWFKEELFVRFRLVHIFEAG